MITAQSSQLHKKLLLVGLTVASVLSFFLSPTLTAAQETVSSPQVTLTAIPPRLGEDNSIRLKPGEKTQVTLRVRNSSSNPITINTKALDFIVGEDGTTPIPVSDSVSNRWSLAKWLTVTPTIQTIQPEQTVGVAVLIEIPDDALPGGHYAMITHSPGSGTAPETTVTQNDSNAAVSQEVGTLLYVIVDGAINEQAFIRDFSFTKFSEFGPVPYNFTLENESDIHIKPQMGINIYNIIGQKVATLQPESKNIFPLTSRAFSGKWDQIWGTGYYRAELTASYGVQGNVTIAKTSFWLLPLKLIIAAIIMLLVLIAMIISIRRHILHRRDDRTQKIKILEDRLKQLESDTLKKFED